MSAPTPEQITKMLACSHENRCGGNDYHLCNDCGLMWDYRRETAEQGLARQLAAKVARLQAQLATAEADRDAARAERDTYRLDIATVCHLSEDPKIVATLTRGQLLDGLREQCVVRVDEAEAELDRARQKGSVAVRTDERLRAEFEAMRGQVVSPLEYWKWMERAADFLKSLSAAPAPQEAARVIEPHLMRFHAEDLPPRALVYRAADVEARLATLQEAEPCLCEVCRSPDTVLIPICRAHYPKPPRPDVRAELEAVVQEMREKSHRSFLGMVWPPLILEWASRLAALAARLGEP